MDRAKKALLDIDRILESAPLSPRTTTSGIPSEKQKMETKAYRPWSQGDLIFRMRSFHWSWTSRLAPADIMTCARYGWYQEDSDLKQENTSTIRCQLCQAQLLLPWDDDMIEDASRTLFELVISKEYFEKISKDGHGMNGICPWSLRPAPEELMAVSFLGQSKERQLFIDRCESFRRMDEYVHVPVSLDEDYDLVDGALKSMQTESSSDKSIPVQVQLLSLHQWICDRSGNSISCRFKCTELPVARDQASSLDPLSAHAWFCPFVQKDSWKEYMKMITSRGPIGRLCPATLAPHINTEIYEEIVNLINK